MVNNEVHCRNYRIIYLPSTVRWQNRFSITIVIVPTLKNKDLFLQQESTLNDETKCSGRCKSMVRRIVEQVRAETEQWSQMQEMLGQVREEMEELQASRDFWEDQALNSEFEIQSLRSKVRQSFYVVSEEREKLNDSTFQFNFFSFPLLWGFLGTRMETEKSGI